MGIIKKFIPFNYLEMGACQACCGDQNDEMKLDGAQPLNKDLKDTEHLKLVMKNAKNFIP